ncbi:hypothetical protein C6P45_004944 [Maudiozyma exigua]|uniref:Nucleoporin Nup120/160 n=1 Tax=Maudiozyma exigua TaxID=34358 RepID=A0A9P7BAU0_MAUEX|nr:hypothetical protein C6P45_004944 [Kazachstania exigua]
MPSLSKIDVNLLRFQEYPAPQNIVNLSLGNDSNINYTSLSTQQQLDVIFSQSSYSNSINISNDRFICYHLTHDYSRIIMYTPDNCINGKTLIINLPQTSLHKHNSIVTLIHEQTLLFHIIVKDGSLLTIKLPLNYILDNGNSVKLAEDWAKVQNPYDFTIRVPHMLYPVSEDLLMVFLEDGGLLGLRKASEEYDFEPLLFNDNSYLQSFTKLFYKNENVTGKAISAVTFNHRYLIILTENYYLKIWDLKSFNLVNEYNLSANIVDEDLHSKDVHQYSDAGNFLSLFQNNLVIYSPQKNGIFQIGSLSVNQADILQFELKNIVGSSLPSSSIWFLADMKLMKPIDLNYTSSYLNLAVLWKSGSLNKFQVLNILYDDLKDYQWIESTNKSLTDSLDELDLPSVIQEENETDEEYYDRCYLTLKSKFSPEAFSKAENVLRENNILIVASDNIKQKKEYLANLETISRDIKGKMDEVSTLSIVGDELILVNTLTPFNHFIYKINTSLEYYYFNLHNAECNDDLSKYLKILDRFTNTLPRHIIHSLSRKYLEISTGKISSTLSPNEKFVENFKTTLHDQFDISNLQKLMDDLNSIDIVSLLNDFIQNYLTMQEPNTTFIESFTTNIFAKISTTEGLYQMISIQNIFVVQILMTFVLLDSTYSYFEEQIEILLHFNQKQLLFQELYKQDKLQLIDAIFKKSTKYSQGAKYYSYLEWNDFIAHNMSLFYSEPLEMNTFFLESIKSYILRSSKQITIEETKMYLRNVGVPFYYKGRKCDEFLLAMLFFTAGQYEEAYKYFQLHDGYKDIHIHELPNFMQNLLESNDSQSLWTPLIKVIVATDHKEARFYYHLSCRYSNHSVNPELALRAIKKSVEISMNDEMELDIVTKQHEQLLAMLIRFSIFDEVIDVLRFGHAFFSSSERYQYFQSLLGNQNPNDKFFSTLINMISTNTEDVLDLQDYNIVDNILSKSLDDDWTSHKKLFTFRYVSKYEREAAEVVFNYWFNLRKDVNSSLKKRYCLIIINILSTFVNNYDQYILNGADVVTLDELKDQCMSL